MGSMSIMHWAIVAAVIALLFGRNKISGLMEDVAHGIKSFKKGMQDEPAEAQKHRRMINSDGQLINNGGDEATQKQKPI